MYTVVSKSQIRRGNATVMENHTKVSEASFLLATTLEGDHEKYLDGRIWVEKNILGLHQKYKLILDDGDHIVFAPIRLADLYMHSYDVTIYQDEEVSGT